MNSLTDEAPEPDADGGVTHTISRTVLLSEQNIKVKLYKTRNIWSNFHNSAYYYLQILKNESKPDCINSLNKPTVVLAGFKMVYLVGQDGQAGD